MVTSMTLCRTGILVSCHVVNWSESSILHCFLYKFNKASNACRDVMYAMCRVQKLIPLHLLPT